MKSRQEDNRGQAIITSIEELTPKGHILRKIESSLDWEKVYRLTEVYYKEDGRPSIDPVVLMKIAMIQHIFGIRSMRQTVAEIDVNVAYRWFLHYDLNEKVPHFATISYAFTKRFPKDLFENIFSLVLETAVERGLVDPSVVFIDGTHIKASANKHKRIKKEAEKTAKVYYEQLMLEVNEKRAEDEKKPFDDDDNDSEKIIKTESKTDPESGIFRKGEHKTDFAYEAHTACDKNNFVLTTEVTAGNVHDSQVFSKVFKAVKRTFDNIKTVAVDAGYKTPGIAKEIIDAGMNASMPYKRPMGKAGFFRPHEFVYDEYFNCIICPENKVLSYSTTNRDGYMEFKSKFYICENCPSRHKCTNSKNNTKIVVRHIWADYMDIAEDFRHSPEGKESYAMRKKTIERVFADAKEKHGMRYTYYRGLTRVTNWVKLKFACMNLKKIAAWS
jgi:transposase/transcription elongation factor Elf1